MDPSVTVLDRFPLQRADVAARVIEGEAVVVTPASGQVHELDPVATFVWERCDGSRSGHALVAEVVAAFEVDEPQARADLAQLLRTFEAKGLVHLGERPGGAP